MSFWHPFADMAAVSGHEVVIDRGEGVWVYDEAGTRYFDATASLWYANIGHGRAEVAEAVAARPAIDVCERLAARAPIADARIFLPSGGGDSIEVAAKLARRHFVQQG